MATRKFFGGILILILATLACSGGAGGPNVQATVNAAVQETQAALGGSDSVETPNLPASSPFATTPTSHIQVSPEVDESKPCGANKWQIFAMSKYEESIGSGLKKVLVQLAFRNGSSLGSRILVGGSDYDQSGPIATTDGGFTYPGKFEIGTTSDPTRGLVPPGFIVTGGARENNPQLTQQNRWSFEVADTQNILSITFPSYGVNCYDENGEYLAEGVMTPLPVDVEKDLRQPLDTASQLENIKSLEDGIDINLGRLELVEAIREAGGGTVDGLLVLRLKFTNASAGYKFSGRIFSYLLDNDATVHQPESPYSPTGQFEAGPSQTANIELKYVISKPADKFALVIAYIVENGTHKTFPIFQVYEIPSNEKSTNSNLITTPACDNDYYPVVRGAKWLYRIVTHSESGDHISYESSEIIEVFSNGFVEEGRSSETEEFPPNANSGLVEWVCLPDGLARSTSSPGDIAIPSEMNSGFSWENNTGTATAATFTALGVESITVPAGTFDAIKVKGENLSPEIADYFIWYAQNTGIVKIVVTQSSVSNEYELISYSIPTP